MSPRRDSAKDFVQMNLRAAAERILDTLPVQDKNVHRAGSNPMTEVNVIITCWPVARLSRLNRARPQFAR